MLRLSAAEHMLDKAKHFNRTSAWTRSALLEWTLRLGDLRPHLQYETACVCSRASQKFNIPVSRPSYPQPSELLKKVLFRPSMILPSSILQGFPHCEAHGVKKTKLPPFIRCLHARLFVMDPLSNAPLNHPSSYEHLNLKP